MNLIIKEEKQNSNELDILFALDNRLFAIECKTGIEKISYFARTFSYDEREKLSNELIKIKKTG